MNLEKYPVNRKNEKYLKKQKSKADLTKIMAKAVEKNTRYKPSPREGTSRADRPEKLVESINKEENSQKAIVLEYTFIGPHW